jgi:uncharacterized membrane protein YfcA
MDFVPALAAFLFAGLFGGALLGLIGIGMALVTVPLLIFTLPLFGIADAIVPVVALATSMAVVSVGSVSSVWSHGKRGNVDWGVVRTTVPASLIGVAAGSLAASHLPGNLLRMIFAVLLVIIAARMLRKARPGSEEQKATSPAIYRTVGAGIGVVGSLIGAGGGVLMVPFLSSRGHRMIRAVATSIAIGLPVSVLGALVYATRPAPEAAGPFIGFLYLPAIAGRAGGSFLGAPIGARFSDMVPSNALKKGFAVVLLVVAVAIGLDV